MAVRSKLDGTLGHDLMTPECAATTWETGDGKVRLRLWRSRFEVLEPRHARELARMLLQTAEEAEDAVMRKKTDTYTGPLDSSDADAINEMVGSGWDRDAAEREVRRTRWIDEQAEKKTT